MRAAARERMMASSLAVVVLLLQPEVGCGLRSVLLGPRVLPRRHAPPCATTFSQPDIVAGARSRKFLRDAEVAKGVDRLGMEFREGRAELGVKVARGSWLVARGSCFVIRDS